MTRKEVYGSALKRILILLYILKDFISSKVIAQVQKIEQSRKVGP